MDPTAKQASSGWEPPRMNLPAYRRELAILVEAFCNATSLRTRNEQFVRMIHWIRADEGPGTPEARLIAFVGYLEDDEPARQEFQAAFGSLLHQLDSVSL